MIKKLIKKICFFKPMTDKEIVQILTIAKLKHYRRGETVFSKDDVGENFFIVKNGRIKIYTPIGTEKKKTFAYLNKGDFFGEMSLLGGKIRSASAEAVEYTELLMFSEKNFKELIRQSPDFTIKLLYTLANRLNKCDKDLESMLFHNIRGRLADAILDLVQEKHTPPIKTYINQTELADYMGTTRVPVCRAINILKRSGVIDYKRGELTVLDMDRLRSIAGDTAPSPLKLPAHVHGR